MIHFKRSRNEHTKLNHIIQEQYTYESATALSCSSLFLLLTGATGGEFGIVPGVSSSSLFRAWTDAATAAYDPRTTWLHLRHIKGPPFIVTNMVTPYPNRTKCGISLFLISSVLSVIVVLPSSLILSSWLIPFVRFHSFHLSIFGEKFLQEYVLYVRRHPVQFY